MFLKRLYLRIWLAVVLAVAVLTLLVGWAWRQAAEPPLRQLVLRNAQGEVIGTGQRRLPHGHGIRPVDEAGRAPDGVQDWVPDGPEFVVRMQDGQTLHISMPRPVATPRIRPPFGFFWTLALVAVAVALATYPIVRRLTRSLERLQHGVQQWGEGNLAARVPEAGQDEVAFLARRFNRAAQQIEALIQSKENLLASQKSLLANASHELRSPLTRIRMSLELMDPSSSAASKAEISRNIVELDQLIEEILLASRLDAQEADLGTVEPVDLLGILAEECARVGAQLEVQPVNVQEFQVRGVAKLLRRAVRNLLENAHRHAAGDDVQVSVRADGEWTEIRVCDRGPGVPEPLRERIFEPFFRLPGASEREGGVGLGLALVKSIAARHGGQVHCEARPQGGACFVLRLPPYPPFVG